MPKYKCIIFDCDGVLVDSETIGNKVLVEMANAYGASIDLDYAFKNFKGNALKHCFNTINKLTPIPLPDSFEKEYRERSFARFKEEIQPVSGIEEVLKALKLPFCVASSGPENKMRLNLELTGLLPYFEDNIFSCYTIKAWKPKPDVFLWAAKSMGFIPEDCLVIEDSIIGLEAANRANMDVLWYNPHKENIPKDVKVLKAFGSMANLLNLIGN